jgi:hypothetical protein
MDLGQHKLEYGSLRLRELELAAGEVVEGTAQHLQASVH